MPLGYGYIKRDVDSYVNWAKIGSDMSKMLADENKRREAIKADIDEKNRQLSIKLADSPDGLHGTAKQAALDLADNASKYQLLQIRLLKSNKLSVRDFTINRQNLNDGIDRGYQALKKYQETFGEKMERYNNNISSAYELAAMTRAEGFGDFSKSGFFVNPINGKVNLAMKELKNVNGKDIYVMSDAPQNTASTDYLDGIISGKWDRFDVDGATTKFSSQLGKEVYSRIANAPGVAYTGAISELMDITKRFNFLTDPKKARELYNEAVNNKKKPFKGTFEEWMKDQNNLMASAQSFAQVEKDNINAALANPMDRLSVLTDNGIVASNGKPYTITWDENEAKANANAILMKRDATTNQDTPAFSKEQEDAATDFAINQARLKYDKIQKTDAFSISRPPQPYPVQQWQAASNEDKKKALMVQGYWNDIARAKTPAEKTRAMNVLLGSEVAIKNGLIGIDASDGKGVKLIYSNPEMNTYKSFKDNSGNFLPYGQFADLGNELSGITDRNIALSAGGGGGDWNNVTDWSGVKAYRQGKTVAPKVTTGNMGTQVLNYMFGGGPIAP